MSDTSIPAGEIRIATALPDVLCGIVSQLTDDPLRSLCRELRQVRDRTWMVLNGGRYYYQGSGWPEDGLIGFAARDELDRHFKVPEGLDMISVLHPFPL